MTLHNGSCHSNDRSWGALLLGIFSGSFSFPVSSEGHRRHLLQEGWPRLWAGRGATDSGSYLPLGGTGATLWKPRGRCRGRDWQSQDGAHCCCEGCTWVPAALSTHRSSCAHNSGKRQLSCPRACRASPVQTPRCPSGLQPRRRAEGCCCRGGPHGPRTTGRWGPRGGQLRCRTTAPQHFPWAPLCERGPVGHTVGRCGWSPHRGWSGPC